MIDYLMFAGDLLIHMIIIFICLGISISVVFWGIATIFWAYDKIKEALK